MVSNIAFPVVGKTSCLVLFIFVFGVVHILKGQNCQLQRAHPAITTSDLNDIVFQPPNRIVAVGSEGTVIISNNLGESWIEIKMGTLITHNAVSFSNDSTLWMTGFRSKTFRSTNLGASWTEMNIGAASPNSTWDIFFLNSEKGWICGDSGKVYRTIDGGLTWQVRIIPGALSFRKIWFVSDIKGWVVGNNGKVYRTNNGGQSWGLVNNTGFGSEEITSLYFFDANIGWMASKIGTIIQTTNGGTSWTRYNLPTPKPSFQSIVFRTATEGWAITGNSLKPIKTTDGGQSWSSPTTGFWFSDPILNSIEMISDNSWMLVGSKGMLASNLFAEDQMDTLNLTVNGLEELSFPNKAFGITTPFNTRNMITNDSGKHWKVVKNNIVYPYYSIHFQTPAKGWGGGFVNLAGRTLDSGKTWIPMNPLPQFSSQVQYYKIRFWNENEGIITTDSGRISKTTDGGVSWTTTNTGTGASFYALDLRQDSLATICGTKGKIFQTNDRGAQWSPIPAPTSQTIRRISFLDSLYGWTVSNDNLLRKTKNRGQSWSPVFQTNQLVNDFVLFDTLTALVATRKGQILKSNDQGNTWHTLYEDSMQAPSSIYCIDKETCYFWGNNGLIIRMICDTIFTSSLSEERGHEIFVFPNPVEDFLQISEPSSVQSFEVFNPLGQLVQMGRWDGQLKVKNWKSGIYLLRLYRKDGIRTLRWIKT